MWCTALSTNTLPEVMSCGELSLPPAVVPSAARSQRAISGAKREGKDCVSATQNNFQDPRKGKDFVQDPLEGKEVFQEPLEGQRKTRRTCAGCRQGFGLGRWLWVFLFCSLYGVVGARRFGTGPYAAPSGWGPSAPWELLQLSLAALSNLDWEVCLACMSVVLCILVGLSCFVPFLIGLIAVGLRLVELGLFVGDGIVLVALAF